MSTSNSLTSTLRGISWMRYLTGVVLIFPIITLVYSGTAWMFLLLTLLFQFAGISEAHEMLRIRGVKPLMIQVYLYAALFSLLALFEGTPYFMVLLTLAFFTLFLQKIVASNHLPHVLTDIAGSLFVIIYLGIFPSYLVAARSVYAGSTLGSCLVIWFFAVIMFGDTGAYLMGRKFGRNKLAPVLSPNKTWEGLIGGILISLSMGLLFRWITLYKLPVLHVFPLVLLLQFFGHFGDLFESMLKRSLRIKDSGGLMPGHGGVLDRLDSLLLSAPIFYFYVTYVLRWAN